MSFVRPARASVVLALCLSFASAPNPAQAADRGRVVRDAPAPAPALDAAAEDARLEAIERLERLLRGTEVSREQRAEMLFRLAELNWEQGRAVYMREMAPTFECQERGVDCDPLSMPIDGAAKWRERSLAIYRGLSAEYPEYPRADEVTWLYGRSLLEMGRAQEANTELTRLVKTWPQSQFATDAWVLVGEYWFEEENVHKALQAWQRAAADETHEKNAYVHYKLAWCWYNLGEPATALAELDEVLGAPTGDSAGRITLRDEALADYVRFFADTGETDLARRLAGRVPGPQIVAMEVKLAEAWEAQGKRELAVRKWRELGAANPEHAEAPRWAEGVARSQLAAAQHAQALAEIEAMDRRFGPGTAWVRANPDRAAAAAERVETLLVAVATAAHQAGKATPAALDVADRAYAFALSRFPEGANAYELRYGWAELLYRQKRYALAHDQYVAVVEMDPQGRHARFCAESAIFAARQLVGPARPVGGTAEVPLGEWEAKQLAAIDRYLALDPQGAKTVDLTYEAGYLLYRANRFRDASVRFRAVMTAAPRSRLAEQSAHLILDGLALVEDWEALAETARAVATNTQLGSEGFRREAREIWEKAAFKQVEARHAKDGDDVAAASGYLAYAEAFPASPVADVALHDAAVLLDGRDVRGAIAARERLVRDHPKSRHRIAALAALGYAHESLAEFGAAADWYERFAQAAPTHPDAPAALWSAGLFRATLGEWREAVADWQRYVTTWPDRAETPGVLLETGPLLARNGQAAAAAQLYARFYTSPPRTARVDQVMFARLAYGELLDDLGRSADAPRHWRESLAWLDAAKGEIAPEAHAYAARMQLALAEPQRRAFLAMRIDGPGARTLTPAQTDALLEKQLLAKVRAMQELEATYAAVIARGAGQPGLDALRQLAEAYEELGGALIASYVPDYLTEDQRWLYEQRMRDLAYAQEERAVATYRTLLDRAFHLDLYDDTTVAVARRLAELRPDENSAVAERLPAPRFLATAVWRPGFEE